MIADNHTSSVFATVAIILIIVALIGSMAWIYFMLTREEENGY